MGKIIILTGPSGVGKGTIEKELFADKSLDLTFSISATTRQKRNGEIEGKHYYFISKNEFEKLIKENAFIEYNQHFDNYYGTLYSEIERGAKENKNLLLEVEINGALNIIESLKKQNKEHLLISIFIVPPSLEELERRIIGRNSETASSIKNRMERAKKELEHKIYFNHIVKNDNIKVAVEEIKNIIKSE